MSNGTDTVGGQFFVIRADFFERVSADRRQAAHCGSANLRSVPGKLKSLVRPVGADMDHHLLLFRRVGPYNFRHRLSLLHRLQQSFTGLAASVNAMSPGGIEALQQHLQRRLFTRHSASNGVIKAGKIPCRFIFALLSRKYPSVSTHAPHACSIHFNGSRAKLMRSYGPFSPHSYSKPADRLSSITRSE